ncbi:putative leucine-rich repeat-containing protein DDB_G0290503 isoform X2 [Chironomus tepperi]|uniref:putative leucine-rich repeat-containing protein DDB_G0290503 isoform X2 n=1 Tax=Chironomus tepperi TaxID=113505 RepID=UPI00391F97D3
MMEMITNTDGDSNMVCKKPPLPPTKSKIPFKITTDKMKSQCQWKIDEENAQQIQKLGAINEKLNLEISDVKKQLHHERSAVRELRATHDSEYRKLKNETKKLLEVIVNVKKSAANNSNKFKAEINKLAEEMTTLKDAKNVLEKKLKNCNCTSAGAITSMVTSKGNKTISNEQTKVDQITATAKAEIQKLLEELKSKEREISNMKKQIKKNESQMRAATTTTTNIIGNTSCEMEEKSPESQVTTSCVEFKGERFVTHVDLSEPMHHQSEESAFKTFIKMENNSTNSNTIVPHLDIRTIKPSSNATTIIEVKESHSTLQQHQKMQGSHSSLSSSTLCCGDDEKKSLDLIQKKYEDTIKELNDSHKRIEELEKSLEEQNNNIVNKDRLQDRMKYLEEREKRLEKESHELREQNELLEFRILELEENQDKWSLRSNLTPDSKDTCNCWREKESDDLMMMTMSSDSGITSPNSHHLDDHQSVSPCSISLMDQLPTDDMRAHIIKMSKRSFYNDDDKLCFSQMLMLLNSLEALSHEQSIIGDDFSSMDYSMDKIKTSPSKIPEPILPPSIQNFNSQSQQSTASVASSSPPKHQKMIATVQPYTTTQNTKAIAEPKKETFEDHNLVTQETQTVSLDDELQQTNAELYAEIEKLNRFRKKVEESTSSVSKNSAQVMSTGFDAIERRHLTFYEERMKMLEGKLQVYESCGDEQMKILSRRLERETQLESRLNILEDSLMKLEEKNLELEEANCELEEIENETRLRWQKLEEDYEVMTQRNSELEMSKMNYQEKYDEARDSVEYLEECLQGCEERIKALETNEIELKRRLVISQSFIPAVALFQMWKMKKIQMPLMVKSSKPASLSHIEIPNDHPIHKKLLESQARERQLTQNINDLNRAYQETLENADNLWAQMEKEYKDKIAHYEKMEVNLRSKIQQLEKRLIRDTEDAHERIAALEDNEYQLKNRAGKLSRELKEQQKKNSELYEELSNSKDEYQKLQAYINGPLADALEKEKRKLRRAEEDLTVVRNALKENETAHKNEQNLLKRQLQKMHKELKNFEVTNGELKEEVETLERRIIELESYRVGDKNRIQELIDELETKSQQNNSNAIHKPLRPLRSVNNTQVRSLAQELNQKPTIMPRQKTVIPIERSAFADAIEKFENHNFEQKREIKSLADCIISNAENNGFVPVKKSFVEEARQKFAKWV